MITKGCSKCGYFPKAGELLNFDSKTNECECPSCGEWCSSCIPTPEDKAFDFLEQKIKEEQVHPLLNPESKHYSMVDNVEAIVRMEQMYSIEDLMAWAKLTAMKYRLRIGNKDDVEKEAKKIETYEAYYRYLQMKLPDGNY